MKVKVEKDALTGNRTRASRVAGENSTTEPSVPLMTVSTQIPFVISNHNRVFYGCSILAVVHFIIYS